MKKIITKIGDVFLVKLDNTSKKYFQYIANDETQLNSSVIRGFKKTYAIDALPNLDDIINDEVDFYAHVVLRWGIDRSLWEKVGNISEIGTLNILFRSSKDSGLKVGEAPIKISHNWQVWKINEPFQYVGKLKGTNKNADIGIVVNPFDIIDRMKTGKYNFVYPGFE